MYLYRFFLIFLFLLPAACAEYHSFEDSTLPCPGGVQRKGSLITHLEKGGVQSILIGDELKLILPSDRFFIKGTTSLKTASYLTLNEIVVLLNQHENYGIQVSVYTPCLHCGRKYTRLAEEQALVLLDYLSSHGLNARLVIAKAWGSQGDVCHSGRFISPCPYSDQPGVFSIEIRTRYLRSKDSI